MNNRLGRIEEEVKRELSDIINNDLKDPRIKGLISITKVSVSRDLKHSKVYISILGKENESGDVLKALKSGRGYIRREVSHRLNLRSTPEFEFIHDHSIEQGTYISELIEKTIHPKQEEDNNE
jgi:ribosome-binding factor A